MLLKLSFSFISSNKSSLISLSINELWSLSTLWSEKPWMHRTTFRGVARSTSEFLSSFRQAHKLVDWSMHNFPNYGSAHLFKHFAKHVSDYQMEFKLLTLHISWFQMSTTWGPNGRVFDCFWRPERVNFQSSSLCFRQLTFSPFHHAKLTFLSSLTFIILHRV